MANKAKLLDLALMAGLVYVNKNTKVSTSFNVANVLDDAARNSNGSLPREWIGKDSSSNIWRGYFKDGKPDSFFPD